MFDEQVWLGSGCRVILGVLQAKNNFYSSAVTPPVSLGTNRSDQLEQVPQNLDYLLPLLYGRWRRETSARPLRIIYQNNKTPGKAMKVVSK